MKDLQTIKTRLAAIQDNFNPQKNTYKVIEYVVNNDLSYNEMLMELSKIRGFSKYPEDLKNEYISIINDIKENIINQRKKEEMDRQKANTQELKDIIDSLEKTRIEYIAKQKEEVEEVLDVDSQIDDNKTETVVKEKEVKQEKEKEKKEEYEQEETEEETDIPKTKKSLIVGIILVIILMILAILFY